MNTLGDAALTYAARGWPVFPCHHLIGGGCSCGVPDCSSPGKHPLTRRGHHDATINPARIRAWWRAHPDANIGVPTGRASGLVVIDLDPPHGPGNFTQLAADRLEHVAAVRTGSGGTHLYFQHPGRDIRNSAGRLAEGVDVRGDGGYILAPPSRHVSGDTYTWRTSSNPPPLPPWLARVLTPERTRLHAPPRRLDGRDSVWAADLLRRELDELARAPEGTRNDRLNRVAFRAGLLIQRGALNPGGVDDALVAAAEASGLPAREAWRTTRAGLDAGQRANAISHGHAR